MIKQNVQKYEHIFIVLATKIVLQKVLILASQRCFSNVLKIWYSLINANKKPFLLINSDIFEPNIINTSFVNIFLIFCL